MERIDLSELHTIETIHSRQSIVNVKRVEHTGTQIQYCIKEIFCHSIDEASNKLQEIVVMAKLSHENIVEIKTCKLVGRYNSVTSIAIVMDYFPDGDLENLIKNKISSNIRWSEAELYFHLIQLVNALAYMQSQKICHRDVKPQNILVRKSGENFTLLLTDFGVSRYYEDDESSIVGTTTYLSPKLREAHIEYILHGTKKLNHDPFKSDVYSLGLVFLYMASFKKDGDLANLNTLPQVTSLKIQEIAKYYPKLSIIIERMLTIEENDRPDFERLKQELEQDPCINCNVCFKIKFIKTMFKYSQTEYLCQECLQGVEVFEERKL